MDRRLGEPQSQSGCSGEEKNSQPLPGFKLQIIQHIAQHYTNELSQLLVMQLVPLFVQGKQHCKR
jgi:hypothetical protein